jgi:hypothetical protein
LVSLDPSNFGLNARPSLSSGIGSKNVIAVFGWRFWLECHRVLQLWAWPDRNASAGRVHQYSFAEGALPADQIKTVIEAITEGVRMDKSATGRSSSPRSKKQPEFAPMRETIKL